MVRGGSTIVLDAQDIQNNANNISALNSNLTANNVPFRFGYDSEKDKYGYILKVDGADTFFPFKSIDADSIELKTASHTNTFTAEVGHKYLVTVVSATSNSRLEESFSVNGADIISHTPSIRTVSAYNGFAPCSIMAIIQATSSTVEFNWSWNWGVSYSPYQHLIQCLCYVDLGE